ncbi:MAG: hypothetical protein ACXWKD_15435, partial [Caldimonas sp.]
DPDAAATRGAEERYMSVRLAAALATFEPAIVPRSASNPPLPDAAALLAALPRCRSEWRGASPLRVWLGEAGLARLPPLPPVEQVAAQLARLDAALLAFSTRANARVESPLGFDAGRWFAAAEARLATPIENAATPGHPFRMHCSDLAEALATLVRGDAAVLDGLAWRGSEGRAALARWLPEQVMQIPAHQVMRRNPWSGIGGCIYFAGDAAGNGGPRPFLAAARSVQRRVCALPELAGARAETGPARREAASAVTSAAASSTASSAASSATAGAPPAARPAALMLAGEPGPADPVDDTRWMVPPSLQAMLQPLESLRQPTGALYRLQTSGEGPPPAAAVGAAAAPNRIVLDGSGVDVGFSIDLTIDPALQALAQKTAACYTGRHDVCRALGLRRAEDKDRPLGEPLLEGAMVRMAAIAVIDVASGRIEALAGAMSPCARQEVDGPGRDAACDTRLPYPVQYRPDALLNPAVFHDAMPASTVKPILATAFLSDPEVGARWLAAEQAAMKRAAPPARESLRGQLMRSDSARFLDRMFCSEKGFADCRRPWRVQAAASAFGWNAGCADARIDCGKRDLLFGGALGSAGGLAAPPSLATPVAFGRLMSEPVVAKPGASMHLMPPMTLDAGIVRRCAAGPDLRRMSDDDWEKCKGGAVVDTVAEGWGQGHARASALGIAGMMATLAAVANGQREVRPPHLVEAVRGVASREASTSSTTAPGRAAVAATRPVALTAEAASVIMSGLSYSHRAGTARTACEQVFDARRCRDFDWIAGKTGTPSFPSDGIPLDELARLCPHGADAATRSPLGPCSSLRPYKWYVAAWRSGPAGPWTKAIAVLTERNWLKKSGQVHGAGDHGPNPSAEIAMQIAGRRVGLIEEAAP